MSASLKSRIARLENGSGSLGDPVIVTFNRFDAPDQAFSGFMVDGRFEARCDGETMDDTEDRLIRQIRAAGKTAYVSLYPVRVGDCKYVEELPE